MCFASTVTKVSLQFLNFAITVTYLHSYERNESSLARHITFNSIISYS